MTTAQQVLCSMCGLHELERVPVKGDSAAVFMACPNCDRGESCGSSLCESELCAAATSTTTPAAKLYDGTGPTVGRA